MHKFPAVAFFAVANELELVRQGAAWLGRFGQSNSLPDIIRQEEPDVLKALRKHCDEAGLECPQPHIDRMLELYEGKHGGYTSQKLETEQRTSRRSKPLAQKSRLSFLPLTLTLKRPETATPRIATPLVCFMQCGIWKSVYAF